MVKKKPAENKPVMTVKPLRAPRGEVIPDEISQSAERDEEPQLTEVAPQAPQVDPAQQLLKILSLQEERQTKTEAQVSALTKAITNMAQAMDAKAEEKKANMGPMDYLKMITDIMNGPIGTIINKAIEGLSGGTEETAAPAAAPVDDKYMKYLQERREKQDTLFDRYQEAIISGLELSNVVKKREMEAEF